MAKVAIDKEGPITVVAIDRFKLRHEVIAAFPLVQTDLAVAVHV